MPQMPVAPHGTLRHWILFTMLLLAVAFLTIAFTNTGNTLAFDNEPAQDFGGGWSLIDASGATYPGELLTLPAQVETDGAIRISKIIPQQIPSPAVLSFRSVQQRVRLYCNGELLYSFGWDNPPLIGKTPGSAWNLVRLPRGCEGQQLIIELDSPYPAYNNSIEKISIGSKAGLLFALLREHALSFVLTLIIFIAGVVTLLAYYLIISRDVSVGKETLYLGLFAIIVSIWLFGECRLTQFFSIPPAANTYTTLIAMLATPIPLVNYIACRRSPESRRLLVLLSKPLSLVFVVSILLQLFNIFDFIEQLPVIHTIFVLGCILLLGTVIFDKVRHPDSGQRQLLISLGIFALFFLLETINHYTLRGNIGGLMRAGVLIFIAMQAEVAFRNAAEIMKMSRLASVDGLTGCLNRTAYNQWLSELDEQLSIGVVIADINNLKMINDTFGHEMGDDAITRCAQCFSEAFSSHGRCFRIGGDEFAMLGKDLTVELLHEDGISFEALTNSNSKLVEYPFVVSYGIAFYDPRHDQSLSDTVRRADKMMYRNKRQFKRDAAAHECHDPLSGE